MSAVNGWPEDMEKEARLLCTCARGRSRPVAGAALQEMLRGEMNWETVFLLGRRHRMLPFLHRHLKAGGDAGVPAEVRDHLRRSYERNAAWNLMMTAALVRLLKVLSREGLRAIAFKGPVTSSMLYGDLGLRGFTDIDLIVPGSEFWRTSHVLADLGLRPDVRLSRRQAQALVHFRNELTFSSEDGSFHVDLHWKLLVHHLRMLPDETGVWERSRELDLAGVRVATLGTPDLLSYFCARAAVDSWATLYRICDIAEALHATDTGGLEEALERAGRVGKRRMMLLGLRMAHVLLDAPVPQDLVRESESTPPVVRMAGRGLQTMFRVGGRQPGLMRRDLSILPLLDSPAQRLTFAAFLPFSPGPNDLRLVDLPRRLWCLYRLLRVARGSLKWAGQCVRAVLRPRS